MCRPQADLPHIHFGLVGEVLDVRNDQVGLIVVDRGDSGIELAQHAVRHEPDHGSCLHAEQRRTERLEHRAHLAERLGARDAGEAPGELVAERLDEDAERLLVLECPRGAVGGVQISRRRGREVRSGLDPELGHMAEFPVFLGDVGLDRLPFTREILRQFASEFPVDGSG